MCSYRISREMIERQALSFKAYIDAQFQSCGAGNLLEYITSQTDIYIFSGIIRNFLSGYIENRDIDIVIKDKIELPEYILHDIYVCNNKFGGLKLSYDDINIDIWEMEKTWGMIQNEHIKLTPYSLIKTAFFNFSSIVYDYNKRRFIISDDFCRFHEEGIIDVVFPKNPRTDACVVNTLYYAEKLGCRISEKLRRWVVNHYDAQSDYGKMQISRYGSIIYDDNVLKSFVELCENYRLEKCTIFLSNGTKQIILKF